MAIAEAFLVQTVLYLPQKAEGSVSISVLIHTDSDGLIRFKAHHKQILCNQAQNSPSSRNTSINSIRNETTNPPPIHTSRETVSAEMVLLGKYASSQFQVSTACKIHGACKSKDNLHQALPQGTAGGGGHLNMEEGGWFVTWKHLISNTADRMIFAYPSEVLENRRWKVNGAFFGGGVAGIILGSSCQNTVQWLE